MWLKCGFYECFWLIFCCGWATTNWALIGHIVVAQVETKQILLKPRFFLKESGFWGFWVQWGLLGHLYILSVRGVGLSSSFCCRSCYSVVFVLFWCSVLFCCRFFVVVSLLLFLCCCWISCCCGWFVVVVVDILLFLIICCWFVVVVDCLSLFLVLLNIVFVLAIVVVVAVAQLTLALCFGSFVVFLLLVCVLLGLRWKHTIFPAISKVFPFSLPNRLSSMSVLCSVRLEIKNTIFPAISEAFPFFSSKPPFSKSFILLSLLFLLPLLLLLLLLLLLTFLVCPLLLLLFSPFLPSSSLFQLFSANPFSNKSSGFGLAQSCFLLLVFSIWCLFCFLLALLVVVVWKPKKLWVATKGF